jgi:TatD family hydrolase
MEEKVSSRVFLSHASGDKAFVRHLATNLREQGIEVWLDEWEIKVGDSIRSKIEAGIQESGWLVVVLSQQSIQSSWVQIELNAALAKELEQKRVFVLPILLEDCDVPLFLKDKRYADFRSDYTIGFKDLLRAVRLIAGITPAYKFGELIDVNAHIWMDDYFESDLQGVIQRARSVGVTTIIVSACNSPYSWSHAIDICSKFQGLYASLALHPVKGATPRELKTIEKFITKPYVVAIGDVQLNYKNPAYTTRINQRKIFEFQLDLARQTGLPVIAEAYNSNDSVRDAEEDFFEIMDSGYQDHVKVAVQTTDVDFARRCNDRNFYFVITGSAAFNKADPVRKLIDELDVTRLLIASDSPFLTPPPFRGRPNEPSYIVHTLEGIRGKIRYTPTRLASLTTSNAKKFLSLDIDEYERPMHGSLPRYTYG